MYEVRIEGNTLRKLIDLFAQAPQIAGPIIARGMNRSLVSYHSTAIQLAPMDKGPLRSGIIMRPAQINGSTIEGSIEATAPHSLWQEQGTGIYGPAGRPIRPKTAKVLSWVKGNTRYFAKEVKGVRPRWFMRGSKEQNQGNTDRQMAQAAVEIAEALTEGAR